MQEAKNEVCLRSCFNVLELTIFHALAHVLNSILKKLQANF